MSLCCHGPRCGRRLMAGGRMIDFHSGGELEEVQNPSIALEACSANLTGGPECGGDSLDTASANHLQLQRFRHPTKPVVHNRSHANTLDTPSSKAVSDDTYFSLEGFYIQEN